MVRAQFREDTAPIQSNRPLVSRHEVRLFVMILIVVLALVLIQPVRFFEPDELCYYFSSRALLHGQLTLTSEQLTSFREEAQAMSSLWPHDLGYVLDGDRYVLVKAPGFSLYLAFLRMLSLERFGNAILVLLSSLMLFVLCCRYSSRGVASTALILVCLSPISLIMIYRTYMSDFAAAAFLFLGAGMSLLLGVPRGPARLSRIAMTAVCGFLLGYAIVLRLTNIGAVFCIVAVYLYVLFRYGGGTGVQRCVEAFSLAFGGFGAMSILAVYNHAVFGEILASGYLLQTIRPQDTTFIVQQFVRGYYLNVYGTIIRNCVILPEILLRGFPWILVLPGAMISARRSMHRRDFAILTAWIAGVCLVYFQYRMLMPHNFVIIARMYLPLIWPAAIFTAIWAEGMPASVVIVLRSLTIVSGLFFFLFFLSLIKAPFFTITLEPLFGGIREVICLFEPLW